MGNLTSCGSEPHCSNADCLFAEECLDTKMLDANEDHVEPPPPPQNGGTILALRIAFAPVDEDCEGAVPSPFGVGDEVAVIQLDKMKGGEALGWRQERSAKQRSADKASGGAQWPDSPRLTHAQRFWHAKVKVSDGRGGFEQHLCLLQVAVSPKDRNMESVQQAVTDGSDAASYAHRFNQYLSRVFADDHEVPRVRVCVPVGAFVLGSARHDIVKEGEAVSLAICPLHHVQKFVFDGGEDFLELPQAFFHHVAWSSGGREMVADLQGSQEDNDVYLVDPVLLRSDSVTITNLLGTLMQSNQAAEADRGPAEQRFEQWHPRCGQLCKSFDPHRRSVHARKHCGLSLPTCGAGGGG